MARTNDPERDIEARQRALEAIGASTRELLDEVGTFGARMEALFDEANQIAVDLQKELEATASTAQNATPRKQIERELLNQWFQLTNNFAGQWMGVTFQIAVQWARQGRGPRLVRASDRGRLQ